MERPAESKSAALQGAAPSPEAPIETCVHRTAPFVSAVHCFWDRVFESIGMWSRRQFLCRAAAATAVSRARALPSRSASDEAFLEDLSRRAFLFFWEQADAKTGLTLDRTRNNG